MYVEECKAVRQEELHSNTIDLLAKRNSQELCSCSLWKCKVYRGVYCFVNASVSHHLYRTDVRNRS
jgi:hypothetical protein